MRHYSHATARFFSCISVAVLGTLGWTDSTEAAAYRILFRGSEAVAIASAGGVNLAGYTGLPAAPGANLSAACPTCVPGGSTDRNFGAGVPNQVVTFLHPYTNKAISIPLTLPMGEPRIVVKRSKIVYDYGLFSSKVIVDFREDGLVEVTYRN